MPILLTCLDDYLTLAGQSHEFWAGNYAQANEGDPIFYRLLTYHPLAYVGGEAALALVFCGMILLMPQTLAMTISIAFALGHMYGASTWLLAHYRYGHELFCGLTLLTAFGMAVAIRWGWRAQPQDDMPLGARLPLALRWGIILVLSVIAIFTYLWPQTR